MSASTVSMPPLQRMVSGVPSRAWKVSSSGPPSSTSAPSPPVMSPRPSSTVRQFARPSPVRVATPEAARAVMFSTSAPIRSFSPASPSLAWPSRLKVGETRSRSSTVSVPSPPLIASAPVLGVISSLPSAAADRVVAGEAVDLVVAGAAVDRVSAGAAGERVVAVTAVDDHRNVHQAEESAHRVLEPGGDAIGRRPRRSRRWSRRCRPASQASSRCPARGRRYRRCRRSTAPFAGAGFEERDVARLAGRGGVAQDAVVDDDVRGARSRWGRERNEDR